VPERIVVTGAQGLLGRHLVARLLVPEGSREVMGMGRSARQDTHYTHELEWHGRLVPAPLPTTLRAVARHPRYQYRALDVGEATATTSAALAEFLPDTVIHVAGALRDEPWPKLLASNVQAVFGLTEALARLPAHQRPRLVVVSSGSVYGRSLPGSLPLRETESCFPLDLYAASKHAGEDVSRVQAAHQGVSVVIGRVFNLLGPGLQHRHLAGSLAGQIAAIKLGLAEPFIRVGPLETSRDFVDVRDAADALAILSDTGEPGEIYNVASGREVVVGTVLDELVRHGGLGDAVVIRRHPGRPADVARSVGDISKLRHLGFEPETRLSQSLSDMLDYYVNDLAPSAA
jgi:GDP-4-dehydro-6-deoxy-D-mannose reductase